MDPGNQYTHLVICQLFYAEEIDSFLDGLTVLKNRDTLFVFNVATFEKKPVHEAIRQRFDRYLIYENPNKGRDIGAKLFLINAVLNLGIEAKYVLIAHDKKSPHVSHGQAWRNELLKIVEPKILNQLPKIFSNEKVGIVASSKFIESEYDEKKKKFKSNSAAILKKLVAELNLVIDDYSFVAGSIFFIRFDILKDFFSTPDHSVIDLITPMESGNVLDFNKGTIIHSWERLLSWIATSKGYMIYGV